MNDTNFTDLTKLARRTGVPKRKLDRIVRRLVKLYDPLRVYLFGSFAWGVPHWNSDLDFCVVVETEEEAKDNAKGRRVLYTILRKPADFYLLSKGDFEKMLSNPATMEHKILHQAKELYAKPDVVFDETQPIYREEYDMLADAASNLRTTRLVLAEPPEIKISLFHVQQSIEQSLKAFRSFHLQGILKIHELDRLRRMCAKIEPEIKNIEGFTLGAAKRMSEYYWLRYGRKVPIPSDIAGVEAEIVVAERVYEFVKRHIGNSAQIPDHDA